MKFIHIYLWPVYFAKPMAELPEVVSSMTFLCVWFDELRPEVLM